MNRVHGDTCRIGQGAFGHFAAEQIVRRIAEAAPVDGAQDVPMVTIVEYDALGEQMVLNLLQRLEDRRVG